MPKELDEIEDMEAASSIASQDATIDAEQSEDLAHADSSNATDETEVDTLSVVRDVVEQREEVLAEAASSAEGEVDGETVDDLPELDNENYTDVPFHKHPRFQDVIREKNSYRDDAQRYRNVQQFIDQNGLSGQEVADGLTMMALAKTDPQKAWESLKPFVQSVLVAAGEVLPEDLAQRVQKKELTRDAALEVSRLRAANKARDFREQYQTQRGDQQRQIDHSHSLINTAQTWLDDRRLKDPNFAAKETRLHEKIAFLHATEGRPTDPAGVKAQLKRAYDAVNSDFAPAAAVRTAPARQQQQKRAIRPVSGGSVASTPPAKPRNTMDVIRQVAAARQSA